MPLIAIAVLAYAAGLVAGFLGAPAAAIPVGIAYSAIAGLRRSLIHAAIGALFTAGGCMAVWSGAHDARCRADAPHRAQWSAQLEDAAAPGIAFGCGEAVRREKDGVIKCGASHAWPRWLT